MPAHFYPRAAPLPAAAPPAPQPPARTPLPEPTGQHSPPARSTEPRAGPAGDQPGGQHSYRWPKARSLHRSGTRNPTAGNATPYSALTAAPRSPPPARAGTRPLSGRTKLGRVPLRV